MTTSLNLYLDELNSSLALGTAGTFIGKNFATIGSTDETLYFQTPIANWRPIFRFKTDGQTDITGEDVMISTVVGLNFIGTSAATASVGATTGLYTPHATLKVNGDNFTSYAINDSSQLLSDTTDPACNVDFQAELSRAIFGTPLGIDMLTNEAELATDYGTTIETMVGIINSSFADVGNSTMLSDVNELSVNRLRVCKKLYQQMRFSTLGRFTLKYQAAVTSTPDFTDGVRCAVSRVLKGSSADPVATGATVDVLMSGSSANSDLVIDNVVIRDIADVFLEDDKVIISKVGPAFREKIDSTNTTVGAAFDAAAASGANTPGGGFMWNTSGIAFQFNLLRNTTVTAYPTSSPPAGSVEYWNGDRLARITSGESDPTQMPDGNWVDPEYYALLINESGNMNVYTNSVATVVEEFTQWTITGWGQTVLRGTISKATVNSVTETTLHVKDREYRKFGTEVNANAQEVFTGPMYTEVSAYKFTGTLGEGTALTVVRDTSPAGPVGVQLGSATETIQIDQINSVQQAILNGTLTDETQLPLQAGDVFNLVMKVSNADDQLNVAGKNLNTIGDTVTRSVKLKIKLSV